MKKEFTVKTPLKVKNAKFITKEQQNPEQLIEIFDPLQQKYVNKYLEEQRLNLTKDFEEKLYEAEQQAFAEGQKAGFDNASSAFKTDVESSIKLFDETLANIKNEFASLIEKTEKDILDLVLAIAKKVVKTEIKTSNDVILGTLRYCLNLISQQKKIIVSVNSTDLDIVQKSIYNLGIKNKIPEQIEIVANDEISPGGCKVAYDTGSIAADIDTQFEEISRQILENGL